MTAHNQAKIPISCTYDERLFIKMLADKAHLNLSEFILSYLRKDFPGVKPSKETLEVMKECEEGRGIKCSSIEDFWEKMGMKPTPYSHQQDIVDEVHEVIKILCSRKKIT